MLRKVLMKTISTNIVSKIPNEECLRTKTSKQNRNFGFPPFERLHEGIPVQQVTIAIVDKLPSDVHQ